MKKCNVLLGEGRKKVGSHSQRRLRDLLLRDIVGDGR